MAPNHHLLDFLKELQGKLVLIVTKKGLRFETRNLQIVNETSVVFTDRRGSRVFIDVEEISQVTEVRS